MKPKNNAKRKTGRGVEMILLYSKRRNNKVGKAKERGKGITLTAGGSHF